MTRKLCSSKPLTWLWSDTEGGGEMLLLSLSQDKAN